jgi:hypothetical protein
VSVTTTLHAIDHESERISRGLASAVEGALWAFEPLRTTKSRLEVTAEPAGRVTLSGNVRSDMMRAMAGRIAARVRGVSSVDNALITDAAIEMQAAEVLGAGPAMQLFTDQVEVESRLGTVYLGGTLRAADVESARTALRDAIVKIEALAGVHGLIDKTEVVAGSAVAAAETTESAGAAAGAGDQAAIQERLRVWKERAAQAS